MEKSRKQPYGGRVSKVSRLMVRTRALAFSGLFLLFIILGGLWVGLVRLVPAGTPRAVVVLAVGVGFAGTFVALLVSGIRQALASDARLWMELGKVLVEVILLVLGFAAIYQHLGIQDNTSPGGPIVHEFWSSAYLSMITFTTVGYGDFHPVGLGRALAALQGFTGYVLLGLLASSAASIISPHSPAGRSTDDEG